LEPQFVEEAELLALDRPSRQRWIVTIAAWSRIALAAAPPARWLAGGSTGSRRSFRLAGRRGGIVMIINEDGIVIAGS
jgi:hypothetical protein